MRSRAAFVQSGAESLACGHVALAQVQVLKLVFFLTTTSTFVVLNKCLDNQYIYYRVFSSKTVVYVNIPAKSAFDFERDNYMKLSQEQLPTRNLLNKHSARYALTAPNPTSLPTLVDVTAV